MYELFAASQASVWIVFSCDEQRLLFCFSSRIRLESNEQLSQEHNPNLVMLVTFTISKQPKFCY